MNRSTGATKEVRIELTLTPNLKIDSIADPDRGVNRGGKIEFLSGGPN